VLEAERIAIYKDAEAGQAIAPKLSFRTTSGAAAALNGRHDCPGGLQPVVRILSVDSRVPT
jgi:hypothetical protein